MLKRAKLLLTAEYFVAWGAQSLALPMNRGQEFHFQHNPSSHSNRLLWNSEVMGRPWFGAIFDKETLNILQTNNTEIARKLSKLLKSCLNLQEHEFKHPHPDQVHSQLEFPKDWGWGSSSTLIAALADWYQVNPYHLLWTTGPGSGYDIACANANGPILYQMRDAKPLTKAVEFKPQCLDQLFLVYQGKKQKSQEALSVFMKNTQMQASHIDEMNHLTQAFLSAHDLSDWIRLMKTHEELVSSFLKMPVIQNQFPGFEGQMKSLGAWGGDFMLVASHRSFNYVSSYFKDKGLETVLNLKNEALWY